MRLIDADELKKDLICFYPEGVPSGLDSETMFKQILHDIDNAPTVTRDRPILGVVKADGSIEFKEIKRERPRGTWRIVNPNEPDYHKGVVKCTNCGQKFNYIDLCKIAPVKCFPDFCSNCGADMREDSDE